MSRHVHCFLAVTTVVAGVRLSDVRREECQATPGQEAVTYTKMVRKVCAMKWVKGDEPKIWEHMREGCWAMRAYNWDIKMRSVIYQHEADQRCALVFSGYNGALTGYIKAALDLSTPMTTWKLCGNELFAPYVKVLRGHTNLANWTRIARFLGGKNTTCRGDLMLVGESAGSAAAEVLAACANSGHLGDVQSEELPSFKVDALYTFGSPATAKKPIRNPLHPKGCFKGKRVFNSRDQVAFHMPINGLKHSLTDSIEIYLREEGPTFKVTPCLSNISSPASNGHSKPGPRVDQQVVRNLKWKMPQDDPVQHEPITYQTALQFFEGAGYGQLAAVDLVEPGSNAFVNAKGERIQNEEPGNVTAEAEQGGPGPQ